jgi:hypothetical protein
MQVKGCLKVNIFTAVLIYTVHTSLYTQASSSKHQQQQQQQHCFDWDANY